MLTFEQFCEFYKTRGYLPNDIKRGARKAILNEARLQERYKAYSRGFKMDNENIVRKTCELIPLLKPDELSYLKENVPPSILSRIDRAHVFSKGRFKHMETDPENIVGLNRYSHSCLDQYRHPITGVNIDPDQVTEWWIRIVGKEKYEELRRKAWRL